MHEMKNISNRERLVWACMLSSSRIGTNEVVYTCATSVVVRQLLGQTTNLTA